MALDARTTTLDAIHEEEKRAGRGERRARAAEDSEVQLPQHVCAIGSRGWLNFGAALWFDWRRTGSAKRNEGLQTYSRVKFEMEMENEDSPPP